MYYFDESGDPGDARQKSNTDYFVIAIYKENSLNNTKDLIAKIRRNLKISDNKKELKWFRFSKEDRTEFEKIYISHILEKTFVICCKKHKSHIFGEKLYEQMLLKLIKEFQLVGKYVYVGEYLARLVENIHIQFKINGSKVTFKNSTDKNVLGIQIADLVAGYFRSKLEKKENTNNKNVINF